MRLPLHILLLITTLISSSKCDHFFNCRAFFQDDNGVLCDDHEQNPLTHYDPLVAPSSLELQGRVKVKLFMRWELLNYREKSNKAHIMLASHQQWHDPRLNFTGRREKFEKFAYKSKRNRETFIRVPSFALHALKKQEKKKKEKHPGAMDIWGPKLISPAPFYNKIDNSPRNTFIYLNGTVTRAYSTNRLQSIGKAWIPCRIINAKNYPHDERECTLSVSTNPVFIVQPECLFNRENMNFNRSTCSWYYDSKSFMRTKNKFECGAAQWKVISWMSDYENLTDESVWVDDDVSYAREYKFTVRFARCGHSIMNFYGAYLIFGAILSAAQFILNVNSGERFVMNIVVILVVLGAALGILNDVHVVTSYGGGTNYLNAAKGLLAVNVVGFFWICMGTRLLNQIQNQSETVQSWVVRLAQHPYISKLLLINSNREKDTILIDLIDRFVSFVACLLCLAFVTNGLMRSEF